MTEIVLVSLLCQQATDFCFALSKRQLKIINGVSSIVSAAYQQDAFLVTLEAFYGFYILLKARHSQHELLKYIVLIEPFSSLYSVTRPIECITTLISLNHVDIS